MQLKNLVLLCFVIMSGALAVPSNNLFAEVAYNEADWAYSQGILTCEAQDPDGQYYFKLTYNAPESTANKADGTPIKGPIDQMGAFDKQAVSPQTVRVKYFKNEPIIINFINEVRWVE